MKNEGNSPEVVEFLIRMVRAEMNTWCLPIGSWPLTLIFDGEQYKSKLALSLGQQRRLQLKNKNWLAMQIRT